MFVTFAGYFMHKRIMLTLIILTFLFMMIYRFVPDRKCSFRKQWPGAVVASIGWLAVSAGCSFYMDNFTNFSLVYGSMAGIMILLLWLYFCMSMIFYGAEVNYFLENKKNYHMLIRIIRPNYKAKQRAGEKKMLNKMDQEAAEKKRLKNLRKRNKIKKK